jgi:hypothetical protein
MHVIVSWEIGAKGERWTSINEALRKELAAFSWAAPLSTLYVVKVSGEDERDDVLAGLRRVAESTREQIKILLSPVMSGGMYTGVLPHDLWLRVNEIPE